MVQAQERSELQYGSLNGLKGVPRGLMRPGEE